MLRSSIKPNPESQRAWQERCRQRARERQSVNPQPRPQFAKVTKKRAATDRIYYAKKKIHLEANPFCKRCGNVATDLHHAKGKAGPLLTDERFFVSLCRICHDWVGANFQAACSLGLSATRFNHEEL